MSPIVPPTERRADAAPVRVVGIGASAGGLEALEQFFTTVPQASGLAYVVVQHLDPTQKALLAELLQRVTAMPVREVVAMMPLQADCVYVIPPNTELSLSGGRLELEAPAEPRGMRLPVNVLFSSLAREHREAAIGVVMSGMGADGTLGLQAIKTLGGLTLAQQPDTAQFDSMPVSAIAAGCVDIIAPPDGLYARIAAWVAGTGAAAVPSVTPVAADAADRALEDIFALLRQQTRHDFSLYKVNTVRRRIERRMAIHAIAGAAQYADHLRGNPQEVELLFKELLIGVTGFFRDPAMWQYLAEVALPALLARRAGGEHRLRAWVVGCSTGEEAYSLAMVFAETLQRLALPADWTLQIFATDLNPDAIAAARRGLYPAAIAANVSEERLVRFFTRQEEQYRVAKAIRDMVLFAEQDVVLDPPFTRQDLLSCRNLMIYFDAALQRKLMPLLHYSLRPGGLLLLGSSETVGSYQRLFSPVESRLRIYLRQESPAGLGAQLLANSFPPLSDMKKDAPVPIPPMPAEAAESLQKAADHVLLQVHAPPAVVVNPSGDIVYISGRTGRYLEPAAGKANWNFHAMLRDGLRAPIAEALRQVAAHGETLHLRGLSMHGPDGAAMVDVTVQALDAPAALTGMAMIVFREIAALPAVRGRRKAQGLVAATHAAELQQCRDEIQTLREENRASREELQSANEELQSTNEELQSANEELTTSKEEMQSMNEELQTVNAEMQNRLDDLALAQSDMKSLLNSTEIAMLFLDPQLNVRRYTERAAKIINLREGDIGRPLSDLTTALQYPMLHEDAQETLRTLVFSEKQIRAADGRWFSVRIMPYRRLDNVIDGAVITFVDITATKELELKLRQGKD